MRLAILSDIHANREALEAVLARARGLAIDRYVCLGDIVGYGADPTFCLETIRALDPLAVVQGNHDKMAATGEADFATSTRAKRAIEWTRKKLTATQLAWLDELPPVRFWDDVIFVHDSPLSPGCGHYITDARSGLADVEGQQSRLCFFGHTHEPLVLQRGVGKQEFTENAPAVLAPDGFYLINLGSVGQPRDGDPRASFGVYDQARGVVELHRVEYDIPTAQAKILAANLPEILATRLSQGW